MDDGGIRPAVNQTTKFLVSASRDVLSTNVAMLVSSFLTASSSSSSSSSSSPLLPLRSLALSARV